MPIEYENAIKDLIIPTMGRYYLDTWSAYEMVEPDALDIPNYWKDNFTPFHEVSRYLMMQSVDNVAHVYGKERKEVIDDANRMYKQQDLDCGIDYTEDIIKEKMWDEEDEDEEDDDSESIEDDGYSEEQFEPVFSPMG